MKEISKSMILCLLVAAVFVMPISAIKNEVSVSVNINYSQNPEFVPGEFIIKFTENTGTSSLTINELNNKYQIFSTHKVFKNAENTILEHIYKFSVPEDADILSIVDEYSSLPHVVYAEPNYIGHTLSIPNDDFFGIQWGLHNTGQVIWGDMTGIPGADIDAPEAWDIETGSSDIIIATPEGVDYTHPDLIDNMWVNEGEIPDNGVDDDGNGYVDDVHGYDFWDDDPDPLDDQGHGTHTAGTAIAIGNNGIGISGVCWSCKIMTLKTTNTQGGSTVDRIAEAIQYAADNGARVLTMSLGFPSPGVMEDAVNYAYDKGVVLVAAAGNSDTDKKNYPAGLNNVIAVAATNQNDERCTKEDWDPDNRYGHMKGSNYGNWVDVAAPGSLIYSTMPTYHVYGNDFYNPHTGQNFTQNYDFMGGTSMATPHVAGLAALLLSHDPSLSFEEVRKIIRANVDPYTSEHYMGTGRINAYKALTRYNGQPDTPQTPTGEVSGRTGRTYTYSTSATDPDGDQLYYVWDWGDGNMSDPVGPFDSGTPCEVEYAWGHDGNYTITVKATDMKGGESYWSDSLLVSMPLIHQKPLFTLIEKLFEWLEQVFGRKLLSDLFNF